MNRRRFLGITAGTAACANFAQLEAVPLYGDDGVDFDRWVYPPYLVIAVKHPCLNQIVRNAQALLDAKPIVYVNQEDDPAFLVRVYGATLHLRGGIPKPTLASPFRPPYRPIHAPPFKVVARWTRNVWLTPGEWTAFSLADAEIV